VTSISVIVPCFNAQAYIREALASVADQGMDDVEIIVVDDGSTDESAALVEREFPHARVLRTTNCGPSHARNVGTELASGRFIQYLDADDMLAPGKLRVQVRALEESGADVAYGDWQKLIPRQQGGWTRGQRVSQELREPEFDLLADFWCPPAVYLFGRSVVERSGGWNEDLPLIEDVRFLIDCTLAGARFVRCPGCMAYYRAHLSGSLSTHNLVDFVRTALQNDRGIEELWRRNGGITEVRKAALVHAYSAVARKAFEYDRGIFEQAYAEVQKLSPGYVPHSPRYLRLASLAVGYRHAEALALWYRRSKRLLRGRSR
jgi:glycosyltransferase involved in cell wall biosynthesis